MDISARAVHISIHALREESDMFVFYLGRTMRISIHALREESDGYALFRADLRIDFNPRSP